MGAKERSDADDRSDDIAKVLLQKGDARGKSGGWAAGVWACSSASVVSAVLRSNFPRVVLFGTSSDDGRVELRPRAKGGVA